MTLIMQASAAHWPLLEDHLRRHNAENGAGGVWFMVPQSHETLCAWFDPTVWAEGAQRVFLLHADNGAVRGHAVVTRNELAPHRCTLGMGIEHAWRGAGLGRALMNRALEWADECYAWTDGQAMSANHAVLALDESVGFRRVGELPDAVRIAGVGHAMTLLTRARP